MVWKKSVGSRREQWAGVWGVGRGVECGQGCGALVSEHTGRQAALKVKSDSPVNASQEGAEVCAEDGRQHVVAAVC